MNIFKKALETIKNGIDAGLREAQLKAGYNAYVTAREKEIADYEVSILEKISDSAYSFNTIKDIYESILLKKEEIELANEALDYIFKDVKKS